MQRLSPFVLVLSFVLACQPATQKTAPATDSERKVLLFFGNSLTEGYGVEAAESFPAQVRQKVDSAGFAYEVVIAGASGETSAGGRQRISWLLEQQQIDVFVLELGANDGLRGIDPESTRRNLQDILDQVLSKNPKAAVVIAGIKVPPTQGPDYAEKFEILFRELAMVNHTAFIPFLLKGVAGNEALMLPDGIHPNAEGHRVVAENVWKVVKEVL
jgi:acyl-CoA thioesterase I